MKVVISGDQLDSLLSLARAQHPREAILLLRGRVDGEVVSIDDFLLPPLAVSGKGFADFPAHLLPIDFSVVGTAHSHPSGSPRPSTGDLNNFYSRIMVILAHPYDRRLFVAYNSKGERLPVEVGD